MTSSRGVYGKSAVAFGVSVDIVAVAVPSEWRIDEMRIAAGKLHRKAVYSDFFLFTRLCSTASNGLCLSHQLPLKDEVICGAWRERMGKEVLVCTCILDIGRLDQTDSARAELHTADFSRCTASMRETAHRSSTQVVTLSARRMVKRSSGTKRTLQYF